MVTMLETPEATGAGEAGAANCCLPQPAAAVALWNPGAAALWSLLLSPALGAYLHMRNWERLGQPGKAARARDWCVAVIAIKLFNLSVITAGAASGHEVGIPPAVSVAVFGAWYLLSGRAQVRHVAAHYGGAYRRRSWLAPVLVAVAATAAFLGMSALLAALLAPLP